MSTTTSVVSVRQLKNQTWGLYRRILCRTVEQNVKISPSCVYHRFYFRLLNSLTLRRGSQKSKNYFSCTVSGISVANLVCSSEQELNLNTNTNINEKVQGDFLLISAELLSHSLPSRSENIKKEGWEVFLSLWNGNTSAGWILKSSTQLDVFYLFAVAEHSQRYRWNYATWAQCDGDAAETIASC